MWLILVGVISGIITGLGMGGGSILILILTSFLSIDQHVAQAMNLIFFIPTSIVSIIIHIKNNNVEKAIGKKLLLSGIIGGAGGAILAQHIKANNLRRYFGIFLLLIGIYEIVTTIKIHLKEKKGMIKKWKN